MAKVSVGLKSLKLGPIAVDGGMGTVLEAYGATVENTAVFSSEEPETTNYPIEESDDPHYTSSKPGQKILSWASYNLDADSLVRLCGGTATTENGKRVYNAPEIAPEIEMSIEVTDLNDNSTGKNCLQF
jgi:hypothetical protein